MLTLMATVSSVSTGPFFIYLLHLFIYLYYNYFLPKTDDIFYVFYVVRHSIFFLKYFWNLN